MTTSHPALGSPLRPTRRANGQRSIVAVDGQQVKRTRRIRSGGPRATRRGGADRCRSRPSRGPCYRGSGRNLLAAGADSRRIVWAGTHWRFGGSPRQSGIAAARAGLNASWIGWRSTLGVHFQAGPATSRPQDTRQAGYELAGIELCSRRRARLARSQRSAGRHGGARRGLRDHRTRLQEEERRGRSGGPRCQKGPRGWAQVPRGRQSCGRTRAGDGSCGARAATCSARGRCVAAASRGPGRSCRCAHRCGRPRSSRSRGCTLAWSQRCPRAGWPAARHAPNGSASNGI